jgi:putative transcriptional regulator
VKAISAITALARRGASALQAKRAVEIMLERGEYVVSLPHIEDRPTLTRELRKAGIKLRWRRSDPVDARKVRDDLGMTQEQFSLRFGIPLATLQNWEQGGRAMDATANAYLRAISRLPAEIAQAQESDEPTELRSQ